MLGSEEDVKMLPCWLWKWRKGVRKMEEGTKACRWPPEAGKDKEMAFPLEPLQWNIALPTL